MLNELKVESQQYCQFAKFTTHPGKALLTARYLQRLECRGMFAEAAGVTVYARCSSQFLAS